jgi:hypothetical protein
MLAQGGDTTEAGLCAVNVIPVVGNVLSTAKRIKDAKDLEGSGDAAKEQEKHLPPMYKKLMGWWDQLAEQVAVCDVSRAITRDVALVYVCASCMSSGAFGRVWRCNPSPHSSPSP